MFAGEHGPQVECWRLSYILEVIGALPVMLRSEPQEDYGRGCP